METIANNTEKLVKIPQKALLSLVADKLKDTVLFPDKLKKAKNYMKKVDLAK